MRLGFCGVGKWAQKLASAFRACGAEIVAYDRRTGDRAAVYGAGARIVGWTEGRSGDFPPLDGFGEHMKWPDQIGNPGIDAIIAAAPPDVTTEVALACSAAGKPVMATKPIWKHPERITAPFYIDLFRLWSSGMRESRALLANFPTHALTVELHGSGPFRDFPGAFDWGPHVIAAAFDLLPGERIDERVSVSEHNGGQLYEVTGTVEQGIAGPRAYRLVFGNGSKSPTRLMRVGRVPVAVEEGEHIGNQTKQEVIEAMCRAFMADVAEGYADTRLLELSRRSTEELRRVVEVAK